MSLEVIGSSSSETVTMQPVELVEPNPTGADAGIFSHRELSYTLMQGRAYQLHARSHRMITWVTKSHVQSCRGCDTALDAWTPPPLRDPSRGNIISWLSDSRICHINYQFKSAKCSCLMQGSNSHVHDILLLRLQLFQI